MSQIYTHLDLPERAADRFERSPGQVEGCGCITRRSNSNVSSIHESPASCGDPTYWFGDRNEHRFQAGLSWILLTLELLLRVIQPHPSTWPGLRSNRSAARS